MARNAIVYVKFLFFVSLSLLDISNTEANCGTNLAASTSIQYFTRPYGLQAGAQCLWNITAPAGASIYYGFLIIRLRVESPCVTEYVETRDENYNLQGRRFCGATLDPTSLQYGPHSHHVEIEYKSNGAPSSGIGFQMYYGYKLERACGKTVAKDRIGGDRAGSPYTGYDAENCCALCLYFRDCRAFVHVSASAPRLANHCWLKTTVTSEVDPPADLAPYIKTAKIVGA